MTATAPLRSPSAASRVLVIGSASNASVLGLLRHSWWQLERMSSLEAVARQVKARSVSVVICGPGEWREVVEATRGSMHPPAVIVLTDAPKDSEWTEVLEAGAHYLDVRNLDGPELFSLLNLLWRTWNKD